MTSEINVTFRNVDRDVLQDFRAEAVRENRTFGQALAEALLLWLQHRRMARKKKMKLSASKPLDFGPGTERLSERADEILYGR
ncbi:MAG: hypothetical protein AB1657_02580 [Candidatus Micrarchaeota archaeon]